MAASFFFVAAGVLVILATLVHVFLGGKGFVDPLLKSKLPDEQKWMAYYAWHGATLKFVFCAAGFFAAAVLERSDYAAISISLCFGLVALAGFVCVKGSMPPTSFPAFFMFMVIGTVGALGFVF